MYVYALMFSCSIQVMPWSNSSGVSERHLAVFRIIIVPRSVTETAHTLLAEMHPDHFVSLAFMIIMLLAVLVLFPYNIYCSCVT